MSRRFSRFGSDAELDGEQSEINISPLIDVVFILLIFFIVTTVFVDETGIEIDKPRAATQRELDKESILIGVSQDGRVYHAGRELGLGGVRSTVSRLLERESVPVVIQADRNTPTEATVAVLDEAKRAGADQVFISTEEAR